MSAHRHVEGGGGYYGGAGADVLARQRGEGEAAWRTGYFPQEAERSWAGGGTGGGAPGAQNSTYSSYSPNNWSCSGHPQHPYPANYPAGDQVQRMESYTNGSYGSPYAPNSMNPTYACVPQPNQYYPPPPQAPYSVDPYKQSVGNPQAQPQWGYPPQHGYQGVSQNPQGYSPYAPHQETVPPYQYQEAASGLHQAAMPQHSPQGEGWVYGVPNPYHWPTAPPVHHNPANTHYVSGGRAGWPGADIPNASYDLKDPSQAPNYNRQRPPYQSYHPETPQTVAPSEPKPNPPTPYYSGSPQMYNRKEPPSQEPASRAKEVDPDPMHNHPAIAKINQVLEKVVDLEREVDEFVGRKTDMSYRYLEELLTKQLLELDSVETGGQENIRQARKEAVNKLQSILERLERKGF
ncbi:BAG family molecular chaperone regulator 4 isoform X2 [Xenopus laevis]|uniref:BAG family molecular chaperone regulator 4 isoform X2 n=1 Tax=Xenopus laevis TaxID=8355 RepID=A0A8J0UT97_XENLA|nr:BAG family molecular chaperone regulator 4 isoform X2 [Xenopus laevis]